MAAKKKTAKKKAASGTYRNPYSLEHKMKVLNFAVAQDGEGRGATLASKKFGHSLNVIRGWAAKANVELQKRVRGPSPGPTGARRKIPTADQMREDLESLEQAEELVADKQAEFDIVRQQLAELEKGRDGVLNRIRKRLL